jgi:transcriptional regulator with XRE-family HTH domain
MATTLGSFIAEQRKKLGLSQKDLASKILREEDGKPISPQYLNDIERDRRQPTSDHLLRQFASVLGAESDYLFFLSGTIPADIRAKRIPADEVVAAFKAFRKS